MHQVQLALVNTKKSVEESSPQHRAAFEIGWDHAHHGLVPEPGLLLTGSPVSQGWLAARAVFGGRTLKSTVFTRQWLQWRLQAWRQQLSFDQEQLSPSFLQQIQAVRCPASLQLLQGLPGREDTLVLERLNPAVGFVAGNVAQMSQAAAQAWQDLSVMDLVRRARAKEQERLRAQAHGVDQDEPGDESSRKPGGQPCECARFWWRLATLRAFATPLPFAEAARLPLAVLPPNRVRLLNAVQGLQALLTLNFMRPGWASRCNALAQHLPQHSLRQDFNLFIGAMAPRVIEAGKDPARLRAALENAWCLERVQRRWTHLVLSLGEPDTQKLLQQAISNGLAAKRMLYLADAQATEGWGLSRPQTTTSPSRLCLAPGIAVKPASTPRKFVAAPERQRPLPAHRPETAGSAMAPGSGG